MGHKSPWIAGEPNTVVEHHAISGKILGRAYYNNSGTKERESHFKAHGRRDKHPFGNKGEHVHDYRYDKLGKVLSREVRELTRQARKENVDILWDYLRKN